MSKIIFFEKSDITKSKAQIICHQVNCQGVMNSGVAKAIKDKWIMVYYMYKQLCNDGKGVPGTCQVIHIDSLTRNTHCDQYVANIFGQNKYGYDGKRYTNYEAVYSALEDLKKFIKIHKVVTEIAFPYKFGCDRGGGNWNIIFTMIEEVFKDLDITIEIHSLNNIEEKI